MPHVPKNLRRCPVCGKYPPPGEPRLCLTCRKLMNFLSAIHQKDFGGPERFNPSPERLARVELYAARGWAFSPPEEDAA